MPRPRTCGGLFGFGELEELHEVEGEVRLEGGIGSKVNYLSPFGFFTGAV